MIFNNRYRVVYGVWRPRLSIGTKTLLAFFALIFLLSGSFYYFSTVKLSERIEKEALNDLKLKLKGSWKIYYSRMEQMKLGMLQAANQGAVRAAVESKDSGFLSGLLSDFKAARPYVDLWAVVDGQGRILASTSKDLTGQRLEINGLVAKAIRAAEPVSSTEEIGVDAVARLDRSLSPRLNDTMALMQVVVTPVISKTKGASSGAFVTGILLNRNSWLTNTIHDTFQVSSAIVDMGVHDPVAVASWGGAKDVFGPAASVPEDVASSIKTGDRFIGASVSRGVEAYFAAEPITNSEGGVIGAIAIGVPDAEVKRHINETETGILILACLGALLGLGLAYFVYIDTTRPIKAVADAMKGIADGDLDSRLELRTKDDFETIGSGFNAMAESIRIREKRLESFNEISKVLLAAKNPDALVKAAVEKLTELTGAEVSLAYLYDEATGVIREVAGFGAVEGLGNIGRGTEAALRCVHEKRTIIQHDENAVSANCTAAPVCRKSDAWFPLMSNGDPIGAVMLGRIDLQDSEETDHLASVIGQISLALDNATTRKEMERLSITDHLTSLYNRRHFFDSMKKDFELSRRYSTPVAVIMIDIDNFKTINDTYGHQQGDVVLSELSALLKAHTRATDLWARYGGEEFIGYVTHTEANGVFTLAEKLRRAVETHRFTGLEEKRITASFGIAFCPYDVAKDTEDLIKISDERLYIAKKSGKNKVEFINEPAYAAGLEQAAC